MSDSAGDRSTRIARWWVGRYTAGLGEPAAPYRRAEIESDLAEHDHYRRTAGWSSSAITRERVRRFVAGVPADISWRHGQLRSRAPRAVAAVLHPVTTVASLLLATYYVAFAAYLLGTTSLAHQQIWGRSPLAGFQGYADEVGVSGPALILAGLGLSLAFAAVVRPIAPVVANAVTLPIAVIGAMFFWLGVWPLALVVIGGAATDLVTRAPQTTAS